MTRTAKMIIHAMKVQRLNQRQLARYTGISEKHISWLLNGHAWPSVAHALRLEEVLGVLSAEELLKTSIEDQLAQHYLGTTERRERLKEVPTGATA